MRRRRLRTETHFCETTCTNHTPPNHKPKEANRSQNIQRLPKGWTTTVAFLIFSLEREREQLETGERAPDGKEAPQAPKLKAEQQEEKGTGGKEASRARVPQNGEQKCEKDEKKKENKREGENEERKLSEVKHPPAQKKRAFGRSLVDFAQRLF